jgi:hypothetical protein
MGQYPHIDYELVSQHLKQLPDGSHPTTRGISNLPIEMVQHGTYTSFFGDHRSLYPIEQLRIILSWQRNSLSFGCIMGTMTAKSLLRVVGSPFRSCESSTTRPSYDTWNLEGQNMDFGVR